MSFILAAVTAVAIVSLGGMAVYSTVGTAQNSANKEPAHRRIPLDSLTNPIEAAVAELTVNVEGSITSCSASHIGPSGQVLTATHCLQQPATCDFDPVVGEYPLTVGTLTVDVSGVNGTGEKWSFPATVLGWSGMYDVMVLQLQPFVKADSSVITLATQSYLTWGSNRQLQRGEPVRALSFDLAFLKKLGRAGPVLHPYADRGTSFAVSAEQVFADLNAEDGASGSAMLNANLQIIMAPLSYAWLDSGDGSDVFAVSGTSADVSGPLVRSILAGTPPNGPAHNKYLVPSLGIIPQFVPSGVNTATEWDPVYYTVLENKGIVFYWLAIQGYYDWITQVIFDCGFPPYTVIPPSMLGAPLTQTFYGNPPASFQDFPAFDSDTIVVLLAMERVHNSGQWVYLGEDNGLETISGVLATGGFGVGDWVQVRIKSANPFEMDNPDAVWEAAYNVTLLPVDPFWDTIQMTPFINYARFIRVNQTQGHPTALHYDPAMTSSRQLTLRRQGHKPGKRTSSSRAPPGGGQGGNPNISPAPPGSDPLALPTLAELYKAHHQRKKQEKIKPKA